MEQENNDIATALSLLNIESPIHSDTENDPPILKETDEVHSEKDPVDNVNDGQNLTLDEACKHVSTEKKPSIPKETDEVHTEKDPVDNANDGQNISLEGACKHVSSEKDNKSDHKIDLGTNKKKRVSSAGGRGRSLARVQRFSKRQSPKSAKSASADLNVQQSGSSKHSGKADNPNEEKIACAQGGAQSGACAQGGAQSGACAEGSGACAESAAERPLSKRSKSAVADLNDHQTEYDDRSSRRTKSLSKFILHTLIPMFPQPIAHPEFFLIVRHQNVSLENVLIVGTTVKGLICVMNLGFNKLVEVFYTIDNSETKNVVNASFFSSNPENAIDQFWFVIYPPIMRTGLRFYIKYTVNGYVFWDNNCGIYYRLDQVKMRTVNQMLDYM